MIKRKNFGMFQSTVDTQLENFIFYSYASKRSQCVVT